MNDYVTIYDVLESRENKGPLPMGGWYADPLSPAQAEALRIQAARETQAALWAGTPCVECRIREMVARYWLGRPVEPDYRNLRETLTGTWHRALTELTYGQLLMSRKLTGALDHLSIGFREAAGLLEPAEYFLLLRRHELLAELPLALAPSPAQTLADLLAEASVIQRLKGATARSRRGRSDPGDTVG
jgi:hypothetical protein